LRRHIIAGRPGGSEGGTRLDLKRMAYNAIWGVWPDDFKPTLEPDRYTMRIWGTKSTLLWPGYVNWRAKKEARKFAVAHGYRDATIVICDRNRLIQRYDYTIDLVR
jgi:hypothetical protein